MTYDEERRWWARLCRCQDALRVEEASPAEAKRAIELRRQGVTPEAAAAELWGAARPYQ
jgi:hypothetical protein